MKPLLIPILAIFCLQSFVVAKPTMDKMDKMDDLMDTVDTLIENGNELGNFQKFTSSLNFTIETARYTFERLVELVNEAKEDIENLNAELKRLYKDEELFRDEYFPIFNNATSKLRIVRQKLRKLAIKTISKTRNVKDLLASLDNDRDIRTLGVALREMKSLMMSSEQILKEAYDEYNLTIEAFENLNSSIQINNKYIKSILKEKSSDHHSWANEVKFTAEFFDVVIGTFNGCSWIAIFQWSTLPEVPYCKVADSIASAIIAPKEDEIRKFENLTNNLLVNGKKIHENIMNANAFLNSEIKLITEWIAHAESVSENIDNYPEKYLSQVEALKISFNNGLDDLQKTAQEFLYRTETFFQEDDFDLLLL